MSDTSTGEKKSVGFTASTHLTSGITAIKSVEEPNTIMVDVGFLKVQKRYMIKFTVPNVLGGSESLECSSASPAVVIKDIHYRSDGKNIVLDIDYKCEFKEGVVYENLSLHPTNDSAKMKVIMHMNILGKGQGTPALKSGVKCIESLQHIESDLSN